MNAIELIIVPDEKESEVAQIFVDGKIDGRKYRFLLDTGAANTTLAGDDYINKLESHGKTTDIVFKCRTGSYSAEEEKWVISRDAFIAKLSQGFRGFVAAYHLLGMDFERLSLQFCFDKRKVFVNPKSGDAIFKIGLGKTSSV